MRKHVFGKQLQRDINERKALFKSLMTALVVRERIVTTKAKAKAIQGQVEKLITKARTNGDVAKRTLQGYFQTPVLNKFVDEVAPRFANRPGGYTRVIKMGNRLRDNARMVILEWVEKPVKATRSTTSGQVKTEKVSATVKIKKEVKAKKPKEKKTSSAKITSKAKK